MKRSLGIAVFLVMTLQPMAARAEGGPYGEGVRLKLIEISPDRSLPIVVDPGNFTYALHHDGSIKARTALRRERGRLKNVDGWRSVGRPSGRNKDLDERTITFMTNRPQIVKRDGPRIFGAVGCVPSFPLGYRAPLLDTVGVAVFDNLVFVHNASLGIVVLARDRDAREYRYVGQTRARSLPLGEVQEYSLGGRHAYVFVENTEWRDMEAWYPTRLRVIVFDDAGNAVLGDGKRELRADGVRVDGGALVLERNTAAFHGPPFPGKSVVFCPHAKNAQYSLLDPVTREPAVLQSQLRLEYRGGELQPVDVSLRLFHPGTASSQVTAVVCQGFPTLEAIRKWEGFGFGHWNDDHTKWIYGGTAEGYIKGSWESSALYWSKLEALLRGSFSVPVIVEPGLEGKLDSFCGTCRGCPLRMEPPAGLGDHKTFSFLKLVEVAKPETREGAGAAAGKEANPGDGSIERGVMGHTARARANPRTKPAESTRPSGHDVNQASPVQPVAGAAFLTADGKPAKGIQVMLEPLSLRLRVVAEDVGAERMYDIVMMQRGKEVARHTITAARQNGTLAPPGKAVYEASFYLTVPHLPGNEGCDPSIPKLMSPGGLVDIVASKPSASEPPPRPRK